MSINLTKEVAPKIGVKEILKNTPASKSTKAVVTKDAKAVSTKATNGASAKVPAIKILNPEIEKMLIQARKTTMSDIKKLHAGDVIKTYASGMFKTAVFIGYDAKADTSLFELANNIWELNAELLAKRGAIITDKKDEPKWNSEKVTEGLRKYPFLMKIGVFQRTFGKEIVAAQKIIAAQPVKPAKPEMKLVDAKPTKVAKSAKPALATAKA